MTVIYGYFADAYGKTEEEVHFMSGGSGETSDPHYSAKVQYNSQIYNMVIDKKTGEVISTKVN